MRIYYMIPGPMGRSESGAIELQRREDLLNSWASADSVVTAIDSATGPASVESGYEDHLSVPALATALVDAERDGVDAMIIGCYDDPGSDALRELATRTVVVGPAMASLHVAALLGTQIGVVTVPEPGSIRRLIYANRMQEHVRDIAVIRSSVLSLREDADRSAEQVATAARRLIEAGADVIVLGCMSLGFLDLDERLGRELGAPVVNPARVALATAELLVRTGLRPSKLAYPTPPKLLGELSLAEFVV